MKAEKEVSANFVIVAILALIFLIVVALYLTGGMNKLVDGYNRVDNLCVDWNESYPPTEEHCNALGMDYIFRGRFMISGCIDEIGEIHYYSFDYKDGYWFVGNTSYKAVFTCDDETKSANV